MKILPAAPPWYAELPAWYLTEAELKALPEYSCSEPTGTTIGKTWKHNINAFVKGNTGPRWMICRYAEHADPNKVTIENYQARLKGQRIKAITGMEAVTI